MAEHNLTLDTMYENWKVYQDQLIKAVAPLTAEQLQLRPAPNLRTVSQQLRHLIAVRARWFHRAAGEGGPEMEEIGGWDHPDAPEHSAAELVTGLETTWRLIRDVLDRWTSEDMAQPIQREYRGETATLQRPWIIWHVIEHDLHHGGELSFALGMHGITGLDI
jgi:uncharacterized damage-inducible protein DinB